MKLYIFVLDHLSTVQKGIQAAHVVAEIMNDDSHPEHDKDVTDWASNHKTIIMLKGGNFRQMIKNLGLAQNSTLPFAYFQEDSDTLGGLVTAVAVLDTEKYDWEKDGYLVEQLRRGEKVVV